MFQIFKRKIKSKIKRIQKLFLTIGNYIYFKVEEAKISLKTSALEKKINQDIAFVGEIAFKTGEKNLERLIKEEAISQLAHHIINDQQRLSGIKKQHLQDITKAM